MGKVFLVGAGPGDPELLTRKAARVLEQADAVLHDSLVSTEVLQLVSTNAEITDVGKRSGLKLLTQDEINSLLVAYAGRYEVVVRLKGGDPMLFGRAAEEIEALRRADVPFEVVPGISAAFGAAAAAGFSLTDRRVASQVLFTTFSRGATAKSLGWREVTSDTTLAIYMPGVDYAEVAVRLVDAGLDPQTPCAVISHATRAEQQIRWTNIAALFDEEKLPAPAVMVVGKVATQDVQEISERAAVGQFSESDNWNISVHPWVKN